MSKVLIGVNRNAGKITDEKTNKETFFDVMTLYFANSGEEGLLGLGNNITAIRKKIGDVSLENVFPGKLLISDKSIMKVKTADFEVITGVSPDYFLAVFEREYLFRNVRILYSFDDFGKPVPASCEFLKKDCVFLSKLALALEFNAACDASDGGSEASDSCEEDFESVDNDGESYIVDTSTGEVDEPKPSEAKKGWFGKKKE